MPNVTIVGFWDEMRNVAVIIFSSKTPEREASVSTLSSLSKEIGRAHV